jgi:hypothetical protein
MVSAHLAAHSKTESVEFQAIRSSCAHTASQLVRLIRLVVLHAYQIVLCADFQRRW